VPYGTLVLQPEQTMRRVLQFVGEPWDPAVLNYYAKNRDHEPAESSKAQVSRPIYHASTGRWRRDMSPADRELFEAKAGELLRVLGYSAGPRWQFDTQPLKTESAGNQEKNVGQEPFSQSRPDADEDSGGAGPIAYHPHSPGPSSPGASA
jgi:hypothetical protein